MLFANTLVGHIATKRLALSPLITDGEELHI
ncbi:Uncharacterised protein [Janthinobacterium lividum]|nr:hypothetical protein JANLI_41960 [Janthinobacterium lividum]STS86133.1 Uncharacterised protein [Janthinobacterium lividum]